MHRVNNFPNRTVARLQPNTDYVLRVRAVNPQGVSRCVNMKSLFFGFALKHTVSVSKEGAIDRSQQSWFLVLFTAHACKKLRVQVWSVREVSSVRSIEGPLSWQKFIPKEEKGRNAAVRCTLCVSIPDPRIKIMPHAQFQAKAACSHILRPCQKRCPWTGIRHRIIITAPHAQLDAGAACLHILKPCPKQCPWTRIHALLSGMVKTKYYVIRTLLSRYNALLTKEPALIPSLHIIKTAPHAQLDAGAACPHTHGPRQWRRLWTRIHLGADAH